MITVWPVSEWGLSDNQKAVDPFLLYVHWNAQALMNDTSGLLTTWLMV